MHEREYIKTDRSILDRLPHRKVRSNKGTYGKVLCIAGSKNMAGAAYLCAAAAYRAGAGLVRVFTPEENRIIIQSLIPEAVLTTFDVSDPDEDLLLEALSWADTAAIGPGLGREPWAERLTELTFAGFQRPLVADADALNHLSGHMEWLDRHRGPLILTPHVGEFARLTGNGIPEILEQVPVFAADFAKDHDCICVLKDAPTAIGDGTGACYLNTTGNNGMSTGGSGDVLTGIIAGLLAQHTPPLAAAQLGVWLHGRAGDLAAEQEGVYGLMARHLLEWLPGAMNAQESARRKVQERR